MLKHRIIVTLLWDGVQVVKPVRFERPYRKLGSLMQYIEVLENRNIDELILVDIEATKNKRKPKWESIKEVASRIYCPLTYGGGISTEEDIRDALNSGADKVAIKTCFYKVPDFSRKFGKQCIVGVIETSKVAADDRGYRFLARAMQDFGAGEILLTSIDQDGTLNGYDLDTISCISRAVDIPVIANGGCGNVYHCLLAIKAGASALAAGSMYLYTDTTPMDVAKYLYDEGVPVRYER